MIGGGGDADGAKDARAKLGTRSESVYKDRFRPSLDCELRLGQAAACGWLEKHPSVRAARPPRGRTIVPPRQVLPKSIFGEKRHRRVRERRRFWEKRLLARRWQPRFFLASKHYLRYYKDNTPGRMLLGAVDLRHVDLPEARGCLFSLVRARPNPPSATRRTDSRSRSRSLRPQAFADIG